MKKITFDFWYGDTLKAVASVDCTFYPNSGVYRGNMYDISGKIIGDYSSKDSGAIEDQFPGICGE